MSQTKKQKQEKALSKLEKEFEQLSADRTRGGYYVGNVFYTPPMNSRHFRIEMEINNLKRKLNIKP